MLFLILGRDGTDAEAQNRRKTHRPAHLERGSTLIERGDLLYGGAMLDPAGNMIGSVMIVNFPSQEKIDEWLKDEPFINGGVWQKVEVHPFRPGPWFQDGGQSPSRAP
jgi:uncharacterized protein